MTGVQTCALPIYQNEEEQEGDEEGDEEGQQNEGENDADGEAVDKKQQYESFFKNEEAFKDRVFVPRSMGHCFAPLNLKQNVYRVSKCIHPEMSLGQPTSNFLVELSRESCKSLIEMSVFRCKQQNKQVVDAEDLFWAVKNFCPGDLSIHSLSEASRANQKCFQDFSFAPTGRCVGQSDLTDESEEESEQEEKSDQEEKSEGSMSFLIQIQLLKRKRSRDDF